MTMHRLHLQVPDETKDVLDDISEAKNLTITEQVRKGIRLLKYIYDAQNRGAQFRVYEKDGSFRVVEILF